MLAGRSKKSGQVVHAQNVAAKAEQLIGERHVDRLNPRDREEFLEQVARLKLTLNDAADELAEAEVVENDQPEEVEEEPVDEQALEAEAAESKERLRRIALSLMTPMANGAEAHVMRSSSAQHRKAEESVDGDEAADPMDAALPNGSGAQTAQPVAKRQTPERKSTKRTKPVDDEPEEKSGSRPRLRLKKVEKSGDDEVAEGADERAG